MTTGNTPNRPVSTVNTTFGILERLAHGGAHTISELATELDMAKSTIHDHISTLHSRGYVTKTEARGYDISMKVLHHGMNARDRRVGVTDAIETQLRSLAENTECNAWYAVRDHDKIVNTHLVRGIFDVPSDGGIGRMRGLHFAAGKSIMAFMSEDAVEKVLESYTLPAETVDTFTGDSWQELRSTIRERKVSVNAEDSTTGLYAMATPVCVDDVPRGAIIISGPARRIQRNNAQLEEALLDAANSVQLSMNFNK